MKKILIADGAKLFRNVVKKELEKGDYQLFEVGNSRELLVQLPVIKPDLVIIEAELSEINGFDTATKFRFEGLEHNGDFFKYNIPIIFVTGSDDVKIKEKAKLFGAIDCITKPFIKGELFMTIEGALNPANEIGKLNVLVVDDDILSRYFIKSVLTGYGILEIVEANSGADAIKIVMNEEKKFDLIICDLFMPNMNGDEVCRIIKCDLGLTDLPIILLSGTADKEDIIEVYKAGATDYLSKPFIREELIARIKTHLTNKKLNVELKKRIDELKKLNKLKDHFLSVAAHDLRSPLTGILCSADFLIDKEYLKSEDKKFVKYIKDSVNFLNNMINDILDLNKIRSDKMDLEMGPLNFQNIVNTSLETMQHMAIPKSIEIISFSDNKDKIPMIIGDYNALMRISNNIISNAIKFTPVGGQISVRIIQDVNLLIFEVKDSGIGISKEAISSLFDKFTKESRKGTSGEKGNGLGLSITKELVEWHDGGMDIESEEGKGTTVSVKFPLIGKSA